MMVAGAFENGPIFIQNTKDTYVGATVFVSLILIVVSCLIFAAVRILGGKIKLPAKKAWPTLERKVSYSSATFARDGITLLIFLAVVLIPSLFAALPAFEALPTDILSKALSRVYPWGNYWKSFVLSYSLGAAVTILNILIGLPMAIIVARKRLGKASSALNVLVDIPIIVPSVALGVSLRFFWKETLAFIPDILLLVFAHLAITYPYFVRSMSAAVERISLELEEASRTLGARPFCVFRTIIFPLTKYSMFSGAIMVFTRSVSETGATMAVSQLKTAPVVLVDWVKEWMKTGSDVKFLEIGFGCGFLILISFIILLALRLIVRGKGRY